MPLDNLNYTLKGKTYIFNDVDNALFNGVEINDAEEWKKERYRDLKKKIKTKYLKDQTDRCAFCRAYVEADGFYEPLEHIVAKTIKPKWIFNPKNLVVACDPCNNLKHTEKTLSDNYDGGDDYPESAEFYSVFHPHFDEWNDHLEIEDDMFIRAKDDNGENTINAYKLTRYQVPINYAREQRLGHEESARKISLRLRKVRQGSDEYNELQQGLQYYKNRIDDKNIVTP